MYVAAIGRTRIRYNAVRAVADADHTVERIVTGPGANVVVRASSELLFAACRWVDGTEIRIWRATWNSLMGSHSIWKIHWDTFISKRPRYVYNG
jgi:hypothetical protein